MSSVDKDQLDRPREPSKFISDISDFKDAVTVPMIFSPSPSISLERAEPAMQSTISVPTFLHSRLHLKCNKCNKHPDGFRGEHELRRHEDRAHNQTRTAWVCVDLSPDRKFLAKCKSCISGKKYYAYYNAAAHLRRSHFNPKGRRKNPPLKNADDQPSMDILKMWMKQVTEVVSDDQFRILSDFVDGETQQRDFVCADERNHVSSAR